MLLIFQIAFVIPFNFTSVSDIPVFSFLPCMNDFQVFIILETIFGTVSQLLISSFKVYHAELNPGTAEIIRSAQPLFNPVIRLLLI